MFCQSCGKEKKDPTGVCENCGRLPTNSYAQPGNNQQIVNQQKPQGASHDMWSYKAKTTTTFVLGIISMVWSLIALVTATVRASRGLGGTDAFLDVFGISVVPFGLALTGLLLMIPLKIPQGHDRVQRTMNIVLASIGIGIIFVSCLIALFG